MARDSCKLCQWHRTDDTRHGSTEAADCGCCHRRHAQAKVNTEAHTSQRLSGNSTGTNHMHSHMVTREAGAAEVTSVDDDSRFD